MRGLAEATRKDLLLYDEGEHQISLGFPNRGEKGSANGVNKYKSILKAYIGFICCLHLKPLEGLQTELKCKMF